MADAFSADVYETLYRLEKQNFWFRGRNRVIRWAFRRFVQSRFATGRMVEIGCGTGFVLQSLSELLHGWTLEGADYLGAAFPYARTRLPAIPLFAHDISQSPLPAKADVIGAFDVLEHIDEDETAFRNINASLEADGMLVATVPQHPFLWTFFDELGSHKRRYCRSDLAAKAVRAGFRIDYLGSFVSTAFPLLILRKLRRRRAAAFLDPRFLIAKELHNPRWVSVPLEISIRWDLLLMKCGLRLPFGGSLLLVASNRKRAHG